MKLINFWSIISWLYPVILFPFLFVLLDYFIIYFVQWREIYTEKKDLIDSIKWEYWIFFNWIN